MKQKKKKLKISLELVQIRRLRFEPKTYFDRDYESQY